MTTSLLVVLSAVFAYQGPPPAKVVPQSTSSEAPPPSRSAASPKRTTQAASPSRAPDGDQQLEKTIRARFAASKIAPDGFQVRVQGGVAFLEGSTSVLQHKGTATRLAKNSGALKVVNRIQVSAEAREKAVSNLSSGRRRAQVKRGDSPEKRSEVPGRT
jgi:hypothetical protein